MAVFNELVVTASGKAYRKVSKFSRILNFIIDKVRKADKLPVLISKRELAQKFRKEYKKTFLEVGHTS